MYCTAGSLDNAPPFFDRNDTLMKPSAYPELIIFLFWVGFWGGGGRGWEVGKVVGGVIL